MFFHQPFPFRGINVPAAYYVLIQFYINDIYKDWIGQEEERLRSWESVIHFCIQS